MDAEVNRALTELTSARRPPLDPGELATAFYRRLGGLYWVDHLERWAIHSPHVDKLPQQRWQSIFGGAPFWATRVNWIFGVACTLEVAGVRMGSDKLGHFVSQGYKYFRRHLQGLSEERILASGRFAERWLFGQATTSVFSNADLVANFEGYRFFRSLFEDGIVAGKSRIVAVRDGRLVIVRPFTFADHVTDYWDEALNPSFFSPALQRVMNDRLPRLCADYAKAPQVFAPNQDAELAARYAPLGLRPAQWNRLDRICAPLAAERAGAPGTTR